MIESTALQSSNETLNNHDELVVNSNKKTRVSIYLTEEAEHAFTELYIARYRKDRKIDRSAVACEAILALYNKEQAND